VLTCRVVLHARVWLVVIVRWMLMEILPRVLRLELVVLRAEILRRREFLVGVEVGNVVVFLLVSAELA
jgi:hypothetical protein